MAQFFLWTSNLAKNVLTKAMNMEVTPDSDLYCIKLTIYHLVTATSMGMAEFKLPTCITPEDKAI